MVDGAWGEDRRRRLQRDHKDDIALLGVVGWNTVPVAFSAGDGTFNVANDRSEMADYATVPGVTALSGH